jgi:hypothetical protein
MTAATPEPTWTLTRSQLIDALANIELHPVLLTGRDKGVAVAGDMADAILGELSAAASDGDLAPGPGDVAFETALDGGTEPAESASEAGAPSAEEYVALGGYFAEIAFFGRIEHTGYVTEVVLHGGQAAYHIDLPEKLWGGNPLAWREYAASAFFEKNPVTEESVRKAWEAERERAERWKQQQAERERQRSQPALECGHGDDDLDDEDDGEAPF